MPVYQISSTVDFSTIVIPEVDGITFQSFAGPGTLSASFNLAQFIHSEPAPAPDVTITGGTGINHLILYVGPLNGVTASNLLINDLVFANWQTQDRVTLNGTSAGQTIVGSAVNDRIYGLGGDDFLRGGEGVDTLFGGAGNDGVQLEGDGDLAYGGSGTDIIVIEVDTTVSADIDIGTGAGVVGTAQFSGFERIDFTAQGGTHTVLGAAFDDVFDAYLQAVVTYAGGGGNEIFRIGHGVTGAVDGGTGIDRLTHFGALDANGAIYIETAALVIDLSDGGGGRDIGTGLSFSGIDRMTGQGGTSSDWLRGGVLDDFIQGWDGNDTIVGGSGDDILMGDLGIDTISYQFDTGGVNVNLATRATSGGQAAGDTIQGFENLSGGLGNDTLTGSTGANLLIGNDGADRISGGGGSDTLQGGLGNDTLTGGAAGDTLTGGGGSDVFDFNAVADSGAVKSDLITDFSRRLDKIDLSGIGVVGFSDQILFDFIGTAAFTVGVEDQLRYEQGAGITTIYGETTGDGVADLRIVLTGQHTLTGTEFVL
jgi:Ca2+-binding RTX toxin-like protein